MIISRTYLCPLGSGRVTLTCTTRAAACVVQLVEVGEVELCFWRAYADDQSHCPDADRGVHSCEP